MAVRREAGDEDMADGGDRTQELVERLLEGDAAASVASAEALLADGFSYRSIIVEGIETAMERLDAKCTLEQFNLLEIMLAGRAMMAVMKALYPDEAAPAAWRNRSVVLASLEGDVHDLGKNILRMVLTAKGFTVVDCGKDCPMDRLVAAVAEHRPLAVGISGLISTIIPQVRAVRPALVERDSALAGTWVLAGGAALKQLTPEQLDVDYVAQSVFEGAAYLEKLDEGAVS
ncbi:MAG: cobalamin-dependent protein [Synergistales bacterium]|nr:cobalamin-dependent protein [Synergistales bacterium]